MARILITGCKGQLGNELQVQSVAFSGYEFIFTDIDTLDISNLKSVSEFIEKHQPDWIVNCAAYNLVDKAESEPEQAFLINSTAVKNITEAIRGASVKFIHVSTDYIYDGLANSPYSETATPNPLSEYGKSKLSGELNALSHSASMVIRTSWLYSSFGNNFVKTMLKYGAERDSLRVVFDQTGTPTYAADLAAAIMQIISGVIRNQVTFKAGIYNYSNEGVCSWYDFASEIIKEAGLSCKVIPILSADYPTAAKRPCYSVMDKTKIRDSYNIVIPHWRSSMSACIKLLT